MIVQHKLAFHQRISITNKAFIIRSTKPDIMEEEPDTTNLVYMDEYLELQGRVWLRRVHAQRQMGIIVLPQILDFPERPDPDDAA